MTKSMAKHWAISSLKNSPVRKFYILQKRCVRDNTDVRQSCVYKINFSLGAILIRDMYHKCINKIQQMQQYAGIYLLQNHSLHVSGVHRTLHQENIKL